MQRLIRLTGLVFLLAGCGRSETYTVRVSGNAGMAFHGSTMVVALGSSQSQSVEGTVPKTYTLTGAIVSVSFQKKGERGKLEVKIEKGGEVIKSGSTTAAYGVVALATQ